MSKLFQVSKDVTVVCNSSKTRNGFKHTAVLYLNGQERASAKVNYLNRTWESFEYESVLEKLADSLDEGLKNMLKDYISNYSGHDDSMLKTTAMVAKMGEFFGKDKKERNDWKARMLKAGIWTAGKESMKEESDLSYRRDTADGQVGMCQMCNKKAMLKDDLCKDCRSNKEATPQGTYVKYLKSLEDWQLKKMLSAGTNYFIGDAKLSPAEIDMIKSILSKKEYTDPSDKRYKVTDAGYS